MVIAARPTIYKGIRMRSRLEARMAALFDRDGWEWQYEPVCFADQAGQYLPDFLTTDRRDCRSFWELKGHLDDADPVLRRMEIIWSSEPEADLVLSVMAGAAAGVYLGGRHRTMDDFNPEPSWHFYPEADARRWA